MASPMFPLTKNETNFQESRIANQMQMVHLVSGLGYSRLERKRLAPPPGRGQLAAWQFLPNIKRSHMVNYSLKLKKGEAKEPTRTL